MCAFLLGITGSTNSVCRNGLLVGDTGATEGFSGYGGLKLERLITLFKHQYLPLPIADTWWGLCRLEEFLVEPFLVWPSPGHFLGNTNLCYHYSLLVSTVKSGQFILNSTFCIAFTDSICGLLFHVTAIFEQFFLEKVVYSFVSRIAANNTL